MKSVSSDIKKILCGIALVILLLQSGAIAQQKPRSLLPEKSVTTETFPAKDVKNGSIKQNTFGPIKKKNHIQVNELKTIDIESIGTIDSSSGGFHKSFWKTTPRALIVRLLKQLPNTTYSKVLRELRRRLLLTRATIPEAPTEVAKENLVVLRKYALFKMGNFQEFKNLSKQIPISFQNEELAKLSVNVDFVTNDLDSACNKTKIWFEKSPSKFWHKALIFCDALNSSWDKVDFGIQLLGELNESEDKTFLALIQVITGDTESLPTLSSTIIKPRDVAMLRSARHGLPSPDPGALPQWLLTAYLEDPSIKSNLRLQLADKAYKSGIMGKASVVKLYETTAIPQDEIDKALSLAFTEVTSMPQALLYRLALSQESNYGKAQAIQQTLPIALRDNFFFEMADLYYPILKTIPIVSEFSWFAADAALLHSINSDLKNAKSWANLAIAESKLDTEGVKNWSKVWPLIRILTGDRLIGWDEYLLKNWKQLILEKDPIEGRGLVSLAYSLMEAVGEPIPKSTWRELIGTGLKTDSTHSIFVNKRAIQEAIGEQAVGETIAILLVSLGELKLKSLAADDLILMVSSINTLGFNEEARRLAFEALIAKISNF
ncbi:MAG: hypothetical protein CMM58_14605 [Rhodospirillaceae bacterium]|nr:hypothetical protein [Rhodospirillaceae bacterium]|tara:strand:+ start:1349 stop:3160 length:1812 start_codon:yes stop_codon:yes gene_type:complete